MAMNTTCQIRVEAKKRVCSITPLKTFLAFYFRLNPLLFLERRMAVLPAPLKFLTISFSHLPNVSVKSFQLPCLLTLGSCQATGDNIIKYTIT